MPHTQRHGLVRHSYEQIELEELMSWRECMTASASQRSGIIKEEQNNRIILHLCSQAEICANCALNLKV